jgi:hypothetical protein
MEVARHVRDMRPTTEAGTQAEGAQGASSDRFDAWRALQKATDKKRADILADVAGHPKGLPSVEELDYMNPPLSEHAVRRHLDTLADVGVVREREFEPGNRVGGYPYQFYEITPEARALFDRNGLFPEEAWQRQYQSVEKTSRIRDIEAMPRPDADG